MKPLLAAGWAVHLAFWALALVRSGRAAAGAGEWVRELALRLAMFALILCGILLPARPLVHLRPPLDLVPMGTFLLGQGLAVTARLRLGRSWTVGVRPRAPVHVVRMWPYSLVSHPIYAGTCLALVAQLAILQNLPALLLVAGAALVVPLKAVNEDRRLSRQGRSPDSPGSGAEGPTTGP